MAEITNLIPHILQWEGGFVNNKYDAGGATNMGVTIGTWKQVGYDIDGDGDIDIDDIKLLTVDDFKVVLKVYWNRWKADAILNQSIANILVDWVWGSGKWGIIIPQRILNVSDDGLVGYETMTALNVANQAELFKSIFEARIKFIEDIVKNKPSQLIFKQGWLNRLDSYKFKE